MRKDFRNLRDALAWIAFHAISPQHLKVLQQELFDNHAFTGHFFIHTIIYDKAVLN